LQGIAIDTVIDTDGYVHRAGCRDDYGTATRLGVPDDGPGGGAIKADQQDDLTARTWASSPTRRPQHDRTDGKQNDLDDALRRVRIRTGDEDDRAGVAPNIDQIERLRFTTACSPIWMFSEELDGVESRWSCRKVP